MDPGVYVNIYEVKLDNENLTLVKAVRKNFPKLKNLREKIKKSKVYPLKDQVYGYGDDLSELRELGFRDFKIKTYDVPQLTCSMILDGFADQLERSGFEIESIKFRRRAFDTQKPIQLSLKEIILLQGCEFRTIFLMNPMEETLVFGIILDLKYKFEMNGSPASYYDIRKSVSEKYSSEKATEIIREIRIKTGDLTPYGRRSSESSSFRMEKIRKIVDRVDSDFILQTGVKATLMKEPIRVVEEGGTDVF
jgi:hypothetical protein